MIDTLLIANRGEIAVRVIRTARALGFRTIAVYSDADADAPHVQLADEAVWIGPSAPAESYLDGERILAAAERSGAQLVHPGYGFLSENADFARQVLAAGLVWIGPPPEAIEAMGDKARSKALMEAAGVRCVPGFGGADPDDGALLAAAAEVGFPLLVKASAGGGGRGMRRVHELGALAEAIRSARSEAIGAFGSGELLLERLVTRAHHVEIQVFADSHGAVIHLGERDCSVQRRHQKVIEEAPSPVVTPEIREAMGAAACRAAASVGYVGAGTVEFLLEDSGAFYFLEMNTRLQVEHPVTEAVTGLDLVAMQIRVALGEALGLTQEQVRWSGHAIEARLYAEDPAAGFLPQPGAVLAWDPPAGVRVDHGLAASGEISAHYDPMVAKVIAHGPDRATALRRLRRALEQTVFFGVQTNRDLLLRVLDSPGFVAGEATTGFLEAHADLVEPVAADPRLEGVAGALWMAENTELDGFRTSHHGALPMCLELDGQRVELRICFEPGLVVNGLAVEVMGEGLRRHVVVAGHRVPVHVASVGRALYLRVMGRQVVVRLWDPTPQLRGIEASGDLRMPMAGRVVSVHCAVGDAVVVGDVLVRVEAMKLESALCATVEGVVKEVRVAAGDAVGAGSLVVRVE